MVSIWGVCDKKELSVLSQLLSLCSDAPYELSNIRQPSMQSLCHRIVSHGLSNLQSLVELSLIWESKHVLEFSTLVPLFLIPFLRVLYLGGILCGDAPNEDEEEIIPPLAAELVGQSRVTNLILDFALVDAGPLIALLKLPSALEKFVFGFAYGGIYHRNQCSE
jgi:hypothetical protein